MITLHSGTPSSGKSYDAIREVMNSLRWGQLVIANFPVKFTDKEILKGYDKRFTFWTNDMITVDNLILYALDHDMIAKKQESQCKVIVDEAGGRYNPRDWDNKDRYEWIQFFSQHAKLGFDFILIAQSDRMIDRQIRSFLEYENKYRKANRYIGHSFIAFILFLPVMILLYMGHLTLFVKVQVWYQTKERLSADFFFYRKKVANRYDRFRMFEGFKFNEALMKKIRAYQDHQEGIVPDEKPSPLPPKIENPDLPEDLTLGDTPISAVFNKSEE